MTCISRTAAALIMLGGLLSPVVSQAEAMASDSNVESKTEAEDLAELDLEDLMNLEITSVSKKAEKLSDSPAAVYVITQEDLRRSGVTSIPEALRMVPGVQVANISANRWAITSRGFNSEFANKLLVLMDGRSVYTPLFAGVFWDVQDTLVEDIDRIEVIRGPGATLWGANTVNGVINIITKTAKETQGGLVTGGIGTEERFFTSARWGGALGENAHYRAYAKYFDRDEYVDEHGDGADDEWDVGRAGFRIDWDASPEDSVTFQGDYYSGEAGERNMLVTSIVPAREPLQTDDVNIDGHNLMGRWTHSFSESSEASLQAYWDRTERDSIIVEAVRHTLDLDFQHGFDLGERQSLLWGLGYRMTKDRIDNSFSTLFLPDHRRDHLFSGFLQDEIDLVEDRLELTLGSKFEHNDYTGFEYQPSGRLLFTPHDDHVFWGSVSRAVRAPARADHHVMIFDRLTTETFSDTIATPVPLPSPPFPPGTTTTVMVPVNFDFSSVASIVGDEDFDSERVVAYELGYRFRPGSRFNVDVAAFYNQYDELRSAEPGLTDSSVVAAAVPGFVLAGLGAGPTPVLTEPGAFTVVTLDNSLEGHSYGVEIASQWDVTPWWRLSGSYSLLKIDMDDGDSLDPDTGSENEGSSPTHQFHVRSFMTLPCNLEFDTMLYWVGNLPYHNVSSYVRVDTRLGWKVTPDVTASLVLQNLFERDHPEFGDTIFWPASQVERGIYGKVEWRF